MLHDDIEQYTNLTGDDGWQVPLMRVGAYLDGYEKGLNVLENIKEEIQQLHNWEIDKYEVIRIIEKYMKESEV